MAMTRRTIRTVLFSFIIALTTLTPLKALVLPPEMERLNLVVTSPAVIDRCIDPQVILDQNADSGWVSVLIERDQREVMIAHYLSCEGVVSASPDSKATLMFVPSDPDYAEMQWNLQFSGLEEAWDLTVGSSEIIVAVIDTGVDPVSTLADFGAGTILKGVSILTDDVTYTQVIKEDTYPGQYSYDGGSHGTAVASVIAAEMDSVGITGIAPGVKILPVKDFHYELYPDEEVGAYMVDIAEGIRWAVDHGADIINLSLGGPTSDYSLMTAVDYALYNGVTVVAASGNNSDHFDLYEPFGTVVHASVSYPAAYSGVIAVGSIDPFDDLSNFSDVYGRGIHVVAYGEYIWLPWNAGNDFYGLQGTSFSSPTVAGVAALMKSLYPSLSPSDVMTILESSTDDITGDIYSVGFDTWTGFGKVNAYRALLQTIDYVSKGSNFDQNNFASFIELKGQHTYEGYEIFPIRDTDYFKFTIYEKENFRIYVDPDGRSDFTVCFLSLNSNGQPLDQCSSYADFYNAGETEILGESFAEPGTYYIKVSEVNNHSVGDHYSIRVEFLSPTLPKFTATNTETTVESGSTSFLPVSLTITESLYHTIAVTKDGLPYDFPEDGVFAEDGEYHIVVDDVLYDPVDYTFTIVSGIALRGVAHDRSYNNSRTIEFNGTATLDGQAFISGTEVSEAGVHTLEITFGGQTFTVVFEIDLTAPVITGLDDPLYLTTTPSITFNEGTATLNGLPFTSGSMVAANGQYVLIVTDKAGNVTQAEFTVVVSVEYTRYTITATRYNAIDLRIDKPIDATYYKVFIKTPESVDYVEVQTFTGTTTTIPNLTTFFTSQVKVLPCYEAQGVTMCGTGSDQKQFTPTLTIPVPVSTSIDYQTYNLQWEASEGADGYDVYTGSINYPRLLGTTTTTSIANLKVISEIYYDGATFNVFVVPYQMQNGVKKTPIFSSIRTTSITVKMQKPQDLRLIPVSTTSVKVVWTAPPSATGYRLYWSDVEGVFKYNVIIGLTQDGLVFNPYATSYILKNLPVGKPVYVWMTASHTDPPHYHRSDETSVVSMVPVPGGPSLSGISTTGTSIKLSWTALTGVSGYLVERYVPATSSYESVGTTTALTLTVDSLTTAIPVTFRVTGYVSANGTTSYGTPSEPVTVTPVPSAVTGLTLQSSSSTSLNVAWTASAGATGYRIYRSSTLTGVYSLVGTTDQTQWLITGLGFNTTSYVKVRPIVTADGVTWEGPLSSAVSAKTALSAITGVTTTSMAYNAASISWSTTPNATGYEIWRSTGTSTYYTLIKTQTTVSFLNTALVTNTLYNYKVRAYAMVGTLKLYGPFSTVSSVRPIPASPTISVVSGGTNALKVSWPAVLGASGYEISYSATEDGTYTLLPLQTAVTVTINGLTVDTPYYVKVRSYRLVGTLKVYSGYSGVVSAKPLPLTPTLTGSSGGFDRVNLSWTAIAGAAGYELYRLDGDTYTLIADQTTLTFTDDELITGTTRSYKVVAYAILSDVKIRSLDSSVINVTPIPSIATNLKPSFIDYNLLSLDWDDVLGATGYEVSYATTSTGAASVIADVSVSDYTRSGLTFNTTGYYRVRAYTTVSDVKVYGNWTTAVAIKAALTAVSNPSAAYTAYNAIQINWNAVNGASGYEVWRSTGTSTYYTLVKTQTTVGFLNTALLTNTKYNYKIRAYRLVGTTKVYGAYSSVVSSIPLPWAPTPTATSAAYNALKISWPAVAGANGYEVSYATSEVGPFTVLPTTTLTSATITNLLTNSTYTVRVRAYRIVSYKKVFGAYSNFVTGTPIPSTPAPKVVSGGFDSLNLSWLAIAGATGYDVQWLNPNTASYETLIDTTSLNAVHSGLTSGVAQSYKVFAYRLVGETKVYSTASVIITGTPIPATALGLKLSATNVSTLDFTWTPVTGASGYEVARSTTSTGVYTTLGSTETAAYQVTGLTFNTTSYIKVRAYTLVNDVKVYGAWTTAVLGKTLPGTPVITLSSPSYTSIQVDWAAVNGVTGYEIWRSTGTSTYYTLIKSQTTVGFLNTGLVFNTRYNYKIRAYKLVGTVKVYGAYSTITSQTTQVSAPSVLSESTFDSITLNWAAVSGANGYEVAIATSENGPFTVSLQTTLTKTFTGLTTGSTYYVKVRSYRLVSTTKVYGPYSEVIEVTLPELPE